MKKGYAILVIGMLAVGHYANAQDNKEQEKAKSTAPAKKSGGGFMNKAAGGLAKLAGGIGGAATGSVTTVSDLSSVNVGPIYMTNLHPASVNVIGQSFLESWEPGGNAVTIMFSPKKSSKFCKLDGKVTIDGQPANFVALGVYSLALKDNNSPKKVEVSTSSGQKGTFTLSPPKHTVKLLSVNGVKENAKVDLTKDVVLELQNGPADNKTPVLVWLTGTKLGIKTFYEVGWFAPNSKITIPAAMFRNMNGVSNNINFKDTYLQVSRSSIDKATDVTGAFTSVEYANMVSDGAFIDVTKEPEFNTGITAQEEVKTASGNKVTYELKKANALFSPDFGTMKTLGVTTFAAQGTTDYYDKKENRLLDATITKSAQFPQFSDAVWDGILEKMYPQIIAVLKDEFGVDVLPIEKVVATNGYKAITPYSKEENNTKSHFTRAYRNTKLVIGPRPIAEIGGVNSGEYKIMAETGANALLRMTINLDMNFEEQTPYMIPKLSFELTGPIIGDTYNTAYMTGTVIGEGYKLKNKKEITPQMLETEVLKQADLVEGFRKGIKDLKAKEKQNGDYETEWKAMNK